MRRTLGDQELELLRFVADHEPISIGEVAQRFGEPTGIARTTVLTVMERLRGKGYLVRERQDGVFAYRTTQTKSAVMNEIVGSFVEKTLGGTVSPFIAFLAQNQNLTDDELEVLRDLLAKSEGDRK